MKRKAYKIRLLSLLLAFTAFATSSYAQRQPAQPKLEDLPKRPLDTIATSDPESFIILYSNNTWSYYRPTLDTVSELSVYREHWDTTQVFSYKSIELRDLPAVIDLNIVQSLDEFKAPITGKVFSKYGPRGRRNHNGVDIPLRRGEPIYAAFDGKVRYARYNTGGFGYLVIVRHKNGLETWSAHLSKLNVKVGDYVKAGQVIGFGGTTGRSRGPHLHFEMRYCDQTFDPEFIIDFETGQLKYQTFALERSFFNIRSRASEILEEDDEYDIPLLASAADNNDTTSADILGIIAQAQEKGGGSSRSAQATLSQSDAVYHTIRQGDMLGKLAIRYGVSIDQICRLNGINRNTVLRLGKKLRIK